MIKTLAKHIKEYKLPSFLAPIFVIMEVIMEILIPLVMSKIIDKGVEEGNMEYVVKMGAVMLVMAVFSLTFGALSGKYAAKASTGFAKNLRKAMFKNIQDFSFANIDKYSTAGLITRLTTDVTNVQNAYQQIVRTFARSPFMLISALCMVVYINKKLSLIFLGAALVLFTVLIFIVTNAHKRFSKVFGQYDELNASVQENISGIRVIKSFVREDYETDKFKKESDNLMNRFLDAEKLIIMNMPAMQFIMYTCTLLLSWFGANMVTVGNLTTGELTSMFTYTSNILMSLMMVSMMFVMVTMAKAAGDRIAEVLNEKSSITNCDEPVFEINDGSVEFKDVYFSYLNKEDKMTLKNINLKINSGETIGVIGATGCGKSALVQLIPRLYDTMSGEVLVSGVNVKNYDIETLRDNVAMVLQKNVLFSGTVKDNLKWGNENATDEEMIYACKLACADEFIETMPLKYNTMIERGGANLSGGQKQRLCIARALIKKPKILILDDSSSALDYKTDAKLRQALKEHYADTTSIIIAQRVSSILHCDLILVMDEGKCIGMGTHEYLLETCKEYKEISDSQMGGMIDG